MDPNIAVMVLTLGVFQLAALAIIVNCTSRVERLLQEKLGKTGPIVATDFAQTTQ